jgi:hypothetical protein
MNDLDGMNTIAWIAAEAEGPEEIKERLPALGREGKGAPSIELSVQGLVAHQFPARVVTNEGAEVPPFAKDAKGGPASALVEPSLVEPSLVEPFADECSIPELLETAAEAQDRTFHEDRERRVYRARTVQMLRRYLRYSIETGRIPSVLGGEFFRAKMTTYSVGTFEDRVIFVHDMEKCLGKLDEFSRQLIARHVLQEHDQEATGRLLHCTERTVRTYVPVVLDLLSQILVDVGLLERLDSKSQKSCQGGKTDLFPVSDCEEGKYKF